MPSGDPRSDEALLTAIRSGDRSALEHMLRRHQSMIWAICRRITGDDHTAADASQEAMISVVKNLHRFDGHSALRTWIYRVSTNAALDEVRRRGRRPEVMADESLHRRSGTVSNGESVVNDRMLVDAALAELPPDFRAAVVLRDLADLDYAEIGDILGVPPGTVRSRIARGRRALATRLSSHEGNPSAPSERPTPGSPPETATS